MALLKIQAKPLLALPENCTKIPTKMPKKTTDLEQHLRLQEEVGQAHPEEGRESAGEGAAEVEVLTVGSEEGGAGEGGKDD